MSLLRSIPFAEQRDERWANDAGSTTVLFRDPEGDDWTIRVSVARVDQAGPFSELPNTRRTLVPLDAPMALRFPDGRELRAARLETLRFEGSPAPVGVLPDGPTRDFNLMLRGDARGEVLPRTLVDSMMLPPAAGRRWLVYLDSGRAHIRVDATPSLELNPRDAALVSTGEGAHRVLIEGAGEIVLVKLYA